MNYRVIVTIPTTISIDMEADSIEAAINIIKCRLDAGDVEFDNINSDFGAAYPSELYELRRGIVLGKNLLLR